jgi:hypothetical protein
METGICQAEIDPVFGRSILFLQSSKSLHGHPKPVEAPGGRSRRSAAAYFYSNGRNDGDGAKFRTTCFPVPIICSRSDKVRNAVKYVTPPVLVDAFRNLKSSFRR